MAKKGGNTVCPNGGKGGKTPGGGTGINSIGTPKKGGKGK